MFRDFQRSSRNLVSHSCFLTPEGKFMFLLTIPLVSLRKSCSFCLAVGLQTSSPRHVLGPRALCFGVLALSEAPKSQKKLSLLHG